MPAKRLKSLLDHVGLPSNAEDCSVVPIDELRSMVTNIDIFTPIFDEPYIMGQIAACNVTNDLFAMNAEIVHNYSCFLGVPTDLPDEFSEQILRGTREFLANIGAKINGGHSIYNPWPLMGGAASSIFLSSEIIAKARVKDGDQLILTKPLGVQPVMAAYRVLQQEIEMWEKSEITRIKLAIDQAVSQMITSLHPIPKIIRNGEYLGKIHCMTDVTGFGVIGHLEEMLESSRCGATISRFPVIPMAERLAEEFGHRLREGYAAEISGGMLMAVDKEIAIDLIVSLNRSNISAFTIGSVHHGMGVGFTKDFTLEPCDLHTMQFENDSMG